MATHSKGSIGYYLCLSIQTQFQLDSYIHAHTNETYSVANLQNYFGWSMLYIIMPTKVGIKSARENVSLGCNYPQCREKQVTLAVHYIIILHYEVTLLTNVMRHIVTNIITIKVMKLCNQLTSTNEVILSRKYFKGWKIDLILHDRLVIIMLIGMGSFLLAHLV